MRSQTGVWERELFLCLVHLVTLSPCHLVTPKPCHLVTLSSHHSPLVSPDGMARIAIAVDANSGRFGVLSGRRFYRF